MAKISNLKIVADDLIPEDIKLGLFNNIGAKKIFFNNECIWQNSNAFVFQDEPNLEAIKEMGEETLVFVGFSDTDFSGSYDLVDNLEEDIADLATGQMVAHDPTATGEDSL